MTEVQKNAPEWELVDVTVVTTDGKIAHVDVVTHNPLRPLTSLETHRMEYRFVARGEGYLRGGDGLPDALLDEVAGECNEACLYQRDVLRSSN